MIRPRKMKQIEMTVLTRDVDTVIEHLGRHGLMEFSGETLADGSSAGSSGTAAFIRDTLERLRSAAAYLNVELPDEPLHDSSLPGETEAQAALTLPQTIQQLNQKEIALVGGQKKLEETITEAKAFTKLNAPFSDLDQLSYLTLRLGRLPPHKRDELQERLSDRAVIVPLDDTGRILAATSRKGRFALDSELKKTEFTPITIPEGYKGIPSDLLDSLNKGAETVKHELKEIAKTKEVYKKQYGQALCKLCSCYLMALKVEELKLQLRGTQNVFVVTGWIPADEVDAFVKEMDTRTQGRVAIRSYNPEEVEDVVEGREKVPVSLKHGKLVKGFEGLVLSYGAPLYGTLDPTPFVAFFFSLLFGIMFGDVGQGAVLILLGFILGAKNKSKLLASFKHFSTPLKAVGTSSVIMGFLVGQVFTDEHLLVKPTRTVLGFFMNLFGITGEAPDRLLTLMPEKGSIEKLFVLFGLALAIGIILNSIGLVVNIINQFLQKKYEKALFSRTGIAGLILFWYAVFIAVKIILAGGRFQTYDYAGLFIPVLLIFFGPAIWRLISGERPVMEHGFFAFVIEGFVGLLESVSAYISSTVSFLRVGAFAISHTVLSFIVFTLSDMVKHMAAGPLFSLFILIIGNAIIILLEGMIVAIQVVRLQYYEFFSKFFSETGKVFTPFRFTRKTG